MKKVIMILLIGLLCSSFYIVGPSDCTRHEFGYLYEHWCTWSTLSSLSGYDPDALLTLYLKSKNIDENCSNPPYTNPSRRKTIFCIYGSYVMPSLQEIINFSRTHRLECGLIDNVWNNYGAIKYLYKYSSNFRLPTYAAYEGADDTGAHAVTLTCVRVENEDSSSNPGIIVSFFNAANGMQFDWLAVRTDKFYIFY